MKKLFIIITALFAPVPLYAQKAIDQAHDITAGVLADRSGSDANSFYLSSLESVLGLAINFIFGVLGVIALIIIINAGFHFMFANGNEQRISRAKSQLTWGAIGLAVILASYSISLFVVDAIEQAAAF
jgi:hypothetical protein